jgi:phosphonoacetaldehyde hydrolase
VGEGRNAGMWTIGVCRSGNELGLSLEEEQALAVNERQARLAGAADRLRQAGAHFVVETIADCPKIVDEIAARVERGERP